MDFQLAVKRYMPDAVAEAERIDLSVGELVSVYDDSSRGVLGESSASCHPSPIGSHSRLGRKKLMVSWLRASSERRHNLIVVAPPPPQYLHCLRRPTGLSVTCPVNLCEVTRKQTNLWSFTA